MADQVTLWRCPTEGCNGLSAKEAPNDNTCWECGIDPANAEGDGWLPLTALIIPEGSVGVVLDREAAEALNSSVRRAAGPVAERVRDALRAALSESDPAEACDHDWVDPSNSVVEAGDYRLCRNCGAFRVPDSADQPKCSSCLTENGVILLAGGDPICRTCVAEFKEWLVATGKRLPDSIHGLAPSIGDSPMDSAAGNPDPAPADQEGAL